MSEADTYPRFAGTNTITDILSKRIFRALVRSHIWQHKTLADKKRGEPSPRLRVKPNSCELYYPDTPLGIATLREGMMT